MKTVALIKNRIGNSRVAVLGCGVSNIPLIDLLIECGNDVCVHDKNPMDKLDPRAREFEERGARFVTGDGYLDNIDADIIFRSPGIRPDHKGIAEAVDRGATLTSEMELFLELTPATVIAITGSDGKTTTTTITYKLLEEQYKNSNTNIYVGGNIGTPLLSKVGDMTDRDICVLELSSFQLFTMQSSPYRAVITNISPNHLDWHKDMDEYVNAKKNIYRNGASLLVTNANDARCIDLARASGCEVKVFSAHMTLEQMKEACPFATGYLVLHEGAVYYSNGISAVSLFQVRAMRVPGKHNIENFMAAIALIWDVVCERTVKETVRTFAGVEHRIEFVKEIDEVFYFNSSIDSSPSRTAAALRAFADLEGRPIVICGGYDKNIPFEPLAKALKEMAKAVILTGSTADKIRDALDDENATIDIYTERDFEEAVNLARSIAKPYDVVLLSPACASFDAFKNFEERGNKFKQIVNDFK